MFLIRTFNSGLRRQNQKIIKNQIQFFWSEKKPQNEQEQSQAKIESPFNQEEFQ